jgi:hypothetical protein
MKYTWFHSAEGAGREMRDAGIHFHEDGQSVDIPDGIGNFHTLDMRGFEFAAINAVKNVNELVRQCLPAGSEEIYNSFDHMQLKDNLTDRKSIFRQEDNSTWLAPIIDQVRKLLFSPNEGRHSILTRDRALHPGNARKWLKVHNRFLAASASHFTFTCGIPPPEQQYKSFRYDSAPSDGQWRNLWIIDGFPALGDPNTRQTHRASHGCLWLCTPVLTKPLFFYLAIIRPLTIELLEKLGMETHFHRFHIFVHSPPTTRKRDSSLFSGSDINTALQHFTRNLPVMITCRLLRNMCRAMFRKFCGELLLDPDIILSTVDEQGQHDLRTRVVHYGHVLNVPEALKMSLTKARKHIATSQVYHAMFGFAVPDAEWESAFCDLSMFKEKKSDRYAYDSARRLVCSSYNLGGSNPSGTRKMVEFLLRTKPYINGYQTHVST